MIQLIRYSFIFGLALLFQSIFPLIFFKSFKIAPDFLLIFLTFIALNKNRLYGILFGFTIGLVQDFLSQIELIGIFSLVKSISGFFIGTLKNYKGFFTRKTILLMTFIIYLIHFSIFYFISFNDVLFDFFLLFTIILINSIINIMFLIIVDKILFDSKTMNE